MATIGELTNVPEPGAGVQSAWAQDVSMRIVHGMTNKAAIDAWTTAIPGTFAIDLATGIMYRRVAAGWSRHTPWISSVSSIADNTNLMTIVVPTDVAPRVLSFAALISYASNTVTAGQVFGQVTINGVVQLESWFGAGNPPTVAHSLVADGYAIPANTAITVKAVVVMSAVVGGFTMLYGDARYHRLSVCVRPGGT